MVCSIGSAIVVEGFVCVRSIMHLRVCKLNLSGYCKNDNTTVSIVANALFHIKDIVYIV